ncbi:MAG: hypothetical protein GY845_09595 [Planctomycetes bacterium]|nr:hypothetical protein [Planctomycetota bacterium]
MLDKLRRFDAWWHSYVYVPGLKPVKWERIIVLLWNAGDHKNTRGTIIKGQHGDTVYYKYGKELQMALVPEGHVYETFARRPFVVIDPGNLVVRFSGPYPIQGPQDAKLISRFILKRIMERVIDHMAPREGIGKKTLLVVGAVVIGIVVLVGVFDPFGSDSVSEEVTYVPFNDGTVGVIQAGELIDVINASEVPRGQ